MVGCWSSVFIRRIIYLISNVYSFDYIDFLVDGNVGSCKPVDSQKLDGNKLLHY